MDEFVFYEYIFSFQDGDYKRLTSFCFVYFQAAVSGHITSSPNSLTKCSQFPDCNPSILHQHYLLEKSET